MEGIQQVPPRFRSAEHWVELVHHGLLDGAIVSSFCLNKPLRAGLVPAWDGMAVVPLGALALQLVAQAVDTRRVLLPRKGAMPLLHQAIEAHGLAVDQQPIACQEPDAWLKRAGDRKLAMPVCSELLGRHWLTTNQLQPMRDQPPLIEQLWLLLPQRVISSRAARQSLRRLRLQLTKLKSMQDRHGIQY
jgi:hypothetical protein